MARTAGGREGAPDVFDPSPRDAGRLVSICTAIDAGLQPFTAVFEEWVEDLDEPAEQQRAHDDAVGDSADQLLEACQGGVLGWLAAAVDTADVEAGEHADDERILELLDELTAWWRGWESVAEAALSALDTAKRVVLARGLIGSEEVHAFYVERLAASHQLRPGGRRAHSVKLSEVIDHHLANLSRHPQRYREQARGDRSSPVASEWVDRLVRLWQCEQTLTRHWRRLRESWSRVEEAARRAVAARHREQVAARERERQREQAERARQLADEAAAVSARVDELTHKAAQLHGPLTLSSKELRKRGWTGLLKALCEGTDQVPGIPRPQARSVLGFASMTAALFARHDDAAATASELRSRLASEGELLRERETLRESIGHAPVSDEARGAWGALNPWLRSSYQWLRAHWEQLASTFEREAPEEARALASVLPELEAVDAVTRPSSGEASR